MLTLGCLSAAFAIYWDDMTGGRHSRAYGRCCTSRSPAHICAALQSDSGEATAEAIFRGATGISPNPFLFGRERYRMRCKVLHQGVPALIGPDTGTKASLFAQPAQTGEVDDLRIRS